MRLFIYEHVSAGGYGPCAPSALRAEGAAMLAALLEDFGRLPDVEVATLINAADEEAAFLDKVAWADAVIVIAPECGGVLERRTRQVLATGRRLLGCHPDAIALTADKWRLARWWQETGVPTPATQLLSPEVRVAPPFPLICKPRHGAGSQATR